MLNNNLNNFDPNILLILALLLLILYLIYLFLKCLYKKIKKYCFQN